MMRNGTFDELSADLESHGGNVLNPKENDILMERKLARRKPTNNFPASAKRYQMESPSSETDKEEKQEGSYKWSPRTALSQSLLVASGNSGGLSSNGSGSSLRHSIDTPALISNEAPAGRVTQRREGISKRRSNTSIFGMHTTKGMDGEVPRMLSNVLSTETTLGSSMTLRSPATGPKNAPEDSPDSRPLTSSGILGSSPTGVRISPSQPERNLSTIRTQSPGWAAGSFNSLPPATPLSPALTDPFTPCSAALTPSTENHGHGIPPTAQFTGKPPKTMRQAESGVEFRKEDLPSTNNTVSGFGHGLAPMGLSSPPTPPPLSIDIDVGMSRIQKFSNDSMSNSMSKARLPSTPTLSNPLVSTTNPATALSGPLGPYAGAVTPIENRSMGSEDDLNIVCPDKEIIFTRLKHLVACMELSATKDVPWDPVFSPLLQRLVKSAIAMEESSLIQSSSSLRKDLIKTLNGSPEPSAITDEDSTVVDSDEAKQHIPAASDRKRKGIVLGDPTPYILDVCKEFSTPFDCQSTLIGRIAHSTKALIGAESCIVLIHDEDDEEGGRLLCGLTRKPQSQGLLSSLAEREEACLIVDVATETRYNPAADPANPSWLCGPAIFGEHCHAYICCTRTRCFTNANETQFNSFLHIAGLALNACYQTELITSGGRRLQNVTQLANILASNMSTADAQISVLMDSVQRCLEASKSALFIVDSHSHDMTRVVNGESPCAVPSRNSIATHVAIAGDVVSRSKVHNDMRFNADVDLFMEGSLNAMLCYPVKTGAGVAAVVQLLNKQRRGEKNDESPTFTTFTEADETLLATLTPFLALAVKYAHLAKAQQQDLRSAKLMADLGRMAAAHPDQSQVLDLLIDQACQLTQATLSQIFIIDSKVETMRLMGSKNGENKFPTSQGIAGYVALNNETVHLRDCTTHPHFDPEVDRCDGRHSTSMLCMPITVSKNVIAVVQLLNKKMRAPFTRQDAEVLEGMGIHLALHLRYNQSRINSPNQNGMSRRWSTRSGSSDTSRRSTRSIQQQGYSGAAARVSHASSAKGAPSSRTSPGPNADLVSLGSPTQRQRSAEKRAKHGLKPLNFDSPPSAHRGSSSPPGPSSPISSSSIPDYQRGQPYHSLASSGNMNESCHSIVSPRSRGGCSSRGRNGISGGRVVPIWLVAVHEVMDWGTDLQSHAETIIVEWSKRLASQQDNLTYDELTPTERILRGLDFEPLEMRIAAAFYSITWNNGKCVAEVKYKSDGLDFPCPIDTQAAADVAVKGSHSILSEVNGNMVSALFYPVTYNHRTVGVIQVVRDSDTPINMKHQDRISRFCLFAGYAYNHWVLQENGQEVNSPIFPASFVDMDSVLAAVAQPKHEDTADASLAKTEKVGYGNVDFCWHTAGRMFPVVTDEHVDELAGHCRAVSRAEVDLFATIDFDVHLYRLAEESDPIKNHTIPLILSLFDRWQLVETLDVDRNRLCKFLIRMKSLYRDVPYHSWYHAMDVVHAMYLLLDSLPHWHWSPLERYALLLACLLHDADHGGVNNAFYTKANTPLGLLAAGFGISGVLELHHCQLGFMVMADDETNPLHGLSKEDSIAAIEIMIKCVAATEVAQHSTFLTRFTQMMGQSDHNDKAYRHLIMQMLMKSADLSNIFRPWHICQQWARCVVEEFHTQGDLERAEGWEVAPMFQRDGKEALTLESSQIGFIDFMGKPHFMMVASWDESLKWIADYIEDNRLCWVEMKDQNTFNGSEEM